MLSAEHVISHKHTSGIDLPESIDEALNAFMASISGFNELFQRLNERTLTRTKAHSPARQVDGYRALNQVLAGELN